MTYSVFEGYRLSPQQERLWSLASGEGGVGVYRAECRVSLSGALEAGALESALRDVMLRHEILRTSLRCPPGMSGVLQVILEQGRLRFHESDISGLPFSTQESTSEGLWRATAGDGDLLAGPEMSALLVKRSVQASDLWLGLPAMSADAASLASLVRDLAAAYGARLLGGMWSGEAVQYVDVSEVLNDLLESEETKRGERHWSGVDLSGVRSLRLPYEREATLGEGFMPRVVSLALAAGGDGLSASAARAGIPESAVLLSLWHSVLVRLTGSEDLVLGMESEGRSYEELAGALGLFARQLPVQVKGDGARSVGDQAAALAEQIRRGVEWQDFFQGEPGSYFPFAFSWLGAVGEVKAGGVLFAVAARRVYGDRFKVRLSCWREGSELRGELQYDESCLSETSAIRLGGHVESAWSSLRVRGLESASGELEILEPSERNRLLVDRNLTVAGSYEREVCLHVLFERQAEREPEAVAVEGESGRLTYGDLEGRANRLARHLRGLGVGVETPVALCVERSPEMVVGLLGILKAGGAYVPLDPSYPQDRLSSMLGDSGARYVVTSGAADSWISGAQVVDLSSAGWREEAPWRLAVEVEPSHLAYVIYTSGSTGRPKGVMVSHRSICNRLLWMQERFALDRTDRVLQKTALSFDASVWEVFVPLLAGARLILARPGGQQDAAYLVEVMSVHKVTVLQLVPSFLRVFLAEPGLERCDSLRRLFSGGEALAKDLVRRCRERLVGVELCNLYGPTESSIDATYHPLGDGEGDGDGEGEGEREGWVPIGRPLSEVEVYVVDGWQRALPEGLPGELCLGGAGLARGYLGRPELTAERFVPHPFSGAAGRRLYRTGDRVRWNASAELEYLGRLDQQVKVRGYRIELGEVESALRRHPSVGEAVVTVGQDSSGEPRLVGYVLGGAEPLSVAQVRRWLEDLLPEYMVPSLLVELKELPLGPNGKVDRSALPDPGQVLASRSVTSVPRTPVEELLAGIWGEVLGVERVGLHDDFFEIGGHSLLATRVVLRVRETLRVEMAIRHLFEAPTIERLGRMVESLRRSGPALEAPPIERVPRDRALPLSFAQQRLWFLDSLDPGSAAYILPEALRLVGVLNVRALRSALEETVRRHESLRTRFGQEAGRPVQLIAAAGAVGLPLVDLGQLQPSRRWAEANRLARQEATRSFDLAQGPLLRMALLRLEEQEHLTLVMMHHIITDGWSTGLFIAEITTLYEGLRRGRVAFLPEPSIQYADYAVWQRSWLSGAVLEAQMGFWRAQLTGAPPVLELPTDHPRPRTQTFRGAERAFAMSKRLSEGLHRFARAEGATLFMLLLAVFKALLSRISGQQDVVVGVPIANRTRLETEGVIGFFANTLVLRTLVEDNPELRSLLAQVREISLGAYAHQEIPFEKLVEELQPERDLAHNPLFQVMFNLQSAGRSNPKIAGLRLEEIELVRPTEKFDLTLRVLEGEGLLSGGFRYATALFDPATIGRLSRHFQNLLANVIERPDLPLLDLPLLEMAERCQILYEWTDTRLDRSGPAVLHRMFEAQVKRTPQAVALLAGGQEWTYERLNRHANRLARALVTRGVRPEEPVILCAERRPEVVAGLFAVLKAGGAYVPVDPELPPARLAAILEQIGPRLFLSRRSAGLQIPSLETVSLDESIVSEYGEDDLSIEVMPEQLAYVVHTSGSTGAPKGVLIAHRGAANYLSYVHETWRLNATDTVLQIAGLSFDASVRDLLAPLTVGARVLLPTAEEAKDSEALAAAIAGERPTCLLSIVPTFLCGLAAAATGRFDGSSVRLILASGEPLRLVDAENVLRAFGRAVLVNQYGPTEGTMTSTFQRVVVSGGGEGIASLGRPIPNARCYVLDSRLAPVPVAMAGEVFIASAGLARGYAGSPDLTAERFVPDPFAENYGGRLYRTGDRGRFIADGRLEFLGRLDRQIKLRGFRIELEEVESALAGHSGLKQNAVVLHEAGPGDRRLIAYVVVGDTTPRAADLRAYLGDRLPEHMIPSAFVFLDRLPVTRNGKVDRRSLPSPVDLPAPIRVPPSSPVERIVAEVWCEVLGIQGVGIEDNFFELGGHSLLAMQVVHRVRDLFQVDVPVREVFTSPTVAEFCSALVWREPQPGQVEKIAAAFDLLQEMPSEEIGRLLETRQERVS